MRYISLLIAAGVFSWSQSIACGGTFITLSFFQTNRPSLQVSSNQVAKLVSAKLYKNLNQFVEIRRIGGGGSIASYTADEISVLGATNGVFNPLIIKGPVEISYQTNPGDIGFVTFEVFSTEDVGSISTAVVIPADASGPVEVSLESSQDFVNWTGTVPGTYGSATQKRFFRVRARIVSP